MVSVNILYFPGTNCQRETAFAFESAGAVTRIVHVVEAIRRGTRIDEADIICIPGGFSFGDHVRAGCLAGLLLKESLPRQLESIKHKPTICICNGFQIAVEAGLFGEGLALVKNECGTFRHIRDQIHMVESHNPSLWLAGLEGQALSFPCAHGEGRLIFTQKPGWQPVLRYPSSQNPDGSMEDIAGISSVDGLIFGLMNHPERNIRDKNNLIIFQNAVKRARGY